MLILLQLIYYIEMGSSNTDLVNTLSELVSHKTVVGHDIEKHACFDHLEKLLKDSKLHIKRFEVDGMPSLIATSQKTLNPKAFLQAHLDVVPCSEEILKLAEQDGKLFGRGVYDMKFAAACYLQLIDELGDSIDEYDFGLMFTSDEEVGGDNGVGYLIDQGYRSEICILPDGGDNWQLETESNGVWLLDVVSTGKTAHGSRPWEGDNAITKLIDVLEDIRKVFPMNNEDKDTLTVSQISGGKAANQVPSSARATLDIRYADQKSYVTKRVKVENIIKDAGLSVETIAVVDSFKIDPKQTKIAEFVDIAERIRGKSVESCRSYGASDAHYFIAKGIPTILIRPEGGGAHSDTEWIDRDGFLEFYDVIKAYIKETTRIA